MADETVSEDIDVEEVDCAQASAELELPEEERRIADENEGAEGPEAVPSDELGTIDDASDTEDDEAAESALMQAFGEASFKHAGGWCGTERAMRRAIRVGRRNGLTVTSLKRNWGSTGSDHHASQTCSFAADLSNGNQPTPEMDRTARRIAAMLGQRGWSGGVLTVNRNGFRWQVLYRTNVGGNHYNHVHVGCRRL